MKETPPRPKSVPQEAIYSPEDNEWELCTYSDNTKKAVNWDAEGILTTEFDFLQEEDSYTYKCYTSQGEIWNEGTYEEGVQVSLNLYRYPHSEKIFKDNFSLPENVARMEDIQFTPDSFILQFNTYDKDGEFIDQVTQQADCEYTKLDYDVFKVNSALKLKNFLLAKVRLRKMIADEKTPPHELFNACLDIKNSDEEISKLRVIVLTQYIEKLYNEEKYNDVIDLINKAREKKKIGSELDNPLWELSIISHLKLGKYPITFQNYALLRALKRIECAGMRTSISDFILDMPEMKTYNQFLESIPKYSRFEDGEIIFDGDVIWNGDFLTNDLKLYYPELEDVYTIIINGDFTVKGKISTERTFNSGIGQAVFKIKGNVEAESLNLFHPDFEVKGNIDARRFIYLHLYYNREDEKFRIKNSINTPLFVIVGDLKLKHTGGFSANCVHIAGISASHEYIKVHQLKDIRKDFFDKTDVDFYALLKAFEVGESIFKEGYDPTVTTTIGWDKLEQAKQLAAENKANDALKILDSIKESDYQEQNIIALERDYYKALIYDEQDEQAKVNKMCKAIIKLYKSGTIFSQPQWKILQFANKKLITEEIAKGNDKKVLELISTINEGNPEYYCKKAELLYNLNKKKEAIFPTYIATKYYGTKGLDEITKSKEFIQFSANCESEEFILPKGYKNKYDKVIDKSYIIILF